MVAELVEVGPLIDKLVKAGMNMTEPGVAAPDLLEPSAPPDHPEPSAPPDPLEPSEPPVLPVLPVLPAAIPAV
ncbi:hypothetical protein ACFXJ8_22340 [Nonomuraea sp. NPDC059194]|uniref:hypothetical protein n=1 Tax=Nonomuraea sp. NPDC059194 TaxID=3346764 RepID=UPI0036828EFD